MCHDHDAASERGDIKEPNQVYKLFIHATNQKQADGKEFQQGVLTGTRASAGGRGRGFSRWRDTASRCRQLEHKENMQDGPGMATLTLCGGFRHTSTGTMFGVIPRANCVQLNVALQTREPPAGPSRRYFYSREQTSGPCWSRRRGQSSVSPCPGLRSGTTSLAGPSSDKLSPQIQHPDRLD